MRSSDSYCSASILPKGSVCPDGQKDVFREVDQSYLAMEHLEGQASSLDLLVGDFDGLGAAGMRQWVSLWGEESQAHLLWVDSKIMHVKFIGLQLTSHPWVLAPRTYARVDSGNLRLASDQRSPIHGPWGLKSGDHSFRPTRCWVVLREFFSSFSEPEVLHFWQKHIRNYPHWFIFRFGYCGNDPKSPWLRQMFISLSVTVQMAPAPSRAHAPLEMAQHHIFWVHMPTRRKGLPFPSFPVLQPGAAHITQPQWKGG